MDMYVGFIKLVGSVILVSVLPLTLSWPYIIFRWSIDPWSVAIAGCLNKSGCAMYQPTP